MVLWFSGAGAGAGLRSCCGQCRTGRRLLLDVSLVLVYSFLVGGGGVVGTAVLEQPVEDLMSLR